jgi:hypothetical protein
MSYLLVTETSLATRVLAEGTEVTCSESSLSVGAKNDGSKSSALKASLENVHIQRLGKLDQRIRIEEKGKTCMKVTRSIN